MNEEYILVAGGAGYIGSHTVKKLKDGGYKVLVVDNLVSGHEWAIKGLQFENADIRDRARLEEIFSKYDISAVMHFAAEIAVPESVQDPLKYYSNNISGTISLLEVVKKFGVKYLIFSSSAAVYGIPESGSVKEDAPVKPVNPYGETKAMVETILRDCGKAYKLNYVCLRYFNAAGADPSGEIGESHNPETHLVPLILEAALNKTPLKIFGTDYSTKDGTCLRDYIHVNDLAEAHILALQYLKDGGKSDIFNLGNSKGFSVKEIIKTVERVTGLTVEASFNPKGDGDPPILIANSEKAKSVLGWEPKYDNLEEIVETAYRWAKSKKS